MKILIQFVAGISILGLSATCGFAVSSYSLTDLGNLGGQSVASALNDNGQVVGEAWLPNGQATAFLWQQETGMRNLGALPGDDLSGAASINDAGQVAGSSQGSPFIQVQGFLWQPGTGMIDIGAGMNMTVEPFGINRQGQIFGTSDIGGFVYSAANGFTEVAVPGISADAIYALNGRGQMVIDTQNMGKVFYSSSEGVVPIRDNAEPAINNFEFGQMNENGMVVGTIPLVTAPTVAMHGFIWDQATGMVDLTPGADDSSWAAGINDQGDVVGEASLAGGPSFPFLYENGTLYNLTPYLNSAAGWSNIALAAINNNGDIAGYGTFNGQTQAFLLTPDGTTSIPEPAALLLAPGFWLLASSRRRPAELPSVRAVPLLSNTIQRGEESAYSWVNVAEFSVIEET